MVHKMVKTANTVFMLSINRWRLLVSIFESPMNRCTDRAATAMLNIIPVVRMVETVAEATPKNRFSTELITELVLGDEKSPNPNPNTKRETII